MSSQRKLGALLKTLLRTAIVFEPQDNGDAVSPSTDSKIGGQPYAELDDLKAAAPD